MRQMQRSWFDILLCDCCLLKLVNDDTSGHDDICGPDEPAPLSNLSHVLDDRQVAVPGDDREEFSTYPCDGCGDEFHGARTLCPVIEEGKPE